MLKFLIPSVLAVFSATALMAEPAAKPIKYSATMSGVVCSACKKKVRDSFAKMGATKVEIKAGEKSGEQVVTFESTNSKLTKESAVKALGEAAEEFKVLALAPKP